MILEYLYIFVNIPRKLLLKMSMLSPFLICVNSGEKRNKCEK